MNENKYIFICGNRIALPVLRYLALSNQLAILVMPRRRNVFVQEVQQLLKDSDIPIVLVTAKDFADTVQQAILHYQPAAGFVFTCSYKIPASVYALVPKGFYNIHPGALPAYRGPDPIFRQLVHKEPYATISIHQLDEGFDTGPVVITDKMRVSITDTYGMAAEKLGELAVQSLSTLLKIMAFGVQVPLKQQDNSKAIFYPKQNAADVTINWQTMDASSITALINACNPWNKGAVTGINEKIIRLMEATCEVAENTELQPGTICSINADGMKVAAVKGFVIIKLIYCNEGFLTPARLLSFGVQTGAQFCTIYV
ncbi:methionyl-tRNA formyltransferase [Ferruginibacter sp.]